MVTILIVPAVQLVVVMEATTITINQLIQEGLWAQWMMKGMNIQCSTQGLRPETEKRVLLVAILQIQNMIMVTKRAMKMVIEKGEEIGKRVMPNKIF
jgi:hypothetical protein